MGKLEPVTRPLFLNSVNQVPSIQLGVIKKRWSDISRMGAWIIGSKSYRTLPLNEYRQKVSFWRKATRSRLLGMPKMSAVVDVYH